MKKSVGWALLPVNSLERRARVPVLRQNHSLRATDKMSVVLVRTPLPFAPSASHRQRHVSKRARPAERESSTVQPARSPQQAGRGTVSEKLPDQQSAVETPASPTEATQRIGTSSNAPNRADVCADAETAQSPASPSDQLQSDHLPRRIVDVDARACRRQREPATTDLQRHPLRRVLMTSNTHHRAASGLRDRRG